MERERFLVRLARGINRRIDYPQGFWVLVPFLLGLMRGRVRPLFRKKNQKLVGGLSVRVLQWQSTFSAGRSFSTLVDLANNLRCLSDAYVILTHSNFRLSVEDQQSLAKILDAEAIDAVISTRPIGEIEWIGSAWRRTSLLDVLEGGQKFTARRSSIIPLDRNAGDLTDPFPRLSAELKRAAASSYPVSVENGFLNRPSVSLPLGKTRVLVIAPWFDMAGSSVLTADLFGHCAFEEFSFVSIAMNEHDVQFNSAEGEKLFRSFSTDLENLGIYHPKGRRKELFVELLKLWRPEIIFGANCSELYHFLPVIKKHLPDVKVIDHLFNTNWHFQTAVANNAMIDSYIVANQEVSNALVKQGVAAEKVRVIYHGIDVARFRRSSQARENRPFTIGFVGRMSHEKRPLDVVKALEHVPGVRGVFVGDGSMRAKVVEALYDHRLLDRTEVIFRPRGPEIYERFDALIVASQYEGLPLVVLEAMAMGLPIISTPVGAIPRVVQDERFGALFPVGGIDALVSHLSQFRDEPSRYLENAAVRRDLIVKDYSLERCAKAYSEEFASVKVGRREDA